MRQMRLEKKVVRPREDRHEVLSLDPRDQDIVRAKERLYARADRRAAA